MSEFTPVWSEIIFHVRKLSVSPAPYHSFHPSRLRCATNKSFNKVAISRLAGIFYDERFIQWENLKRYTMLEIGDWCLWYGADQALEASAERWPRLSTLSKIRLFIGCWWFERCWVVDQNSSRHRGPNGDEMRPWETAILATKLLIRVNEIV